MTEPGLPPEATAFHREALVRALGSEPGCALVPAGLPVPVAGTDQFHDFRPHPDHVWLTGLWEPGAVLASDPGDGFTLFVRIPGPEERVWEGGTADTESFSRDQIRYPISPIATDSVGANPIARSTADQNSQPAVRLVATPFAGASSESPLSSRRNGRGRNRSDAPS